MSLYGAYTTGGMQAAQAMQASQASTDFGMNAQQMQQMGMGLAIAGGISNIATSYMNFQAQRRISLMQFQMENRYREQQHEYQKKLFSENYRRVRESVAENYSQIQERILQERVSSAMQIGEVQRQSRNMQSSATVQAAERGVDQGNLLIDAIVANELRASTAISMEEEWRVKALHSQMKGLEAQAEARIASVNPQPLAPIPIPAPIQPPNPFAMAMTTMADAFAMYARFQPQAAQERQAAANL